MDEENKIEEVKEKISLSSKFKQSNFYFFRLLRNKKFLLFFFTLISIIAGFILFLLDKINCFRPERLTIQALINIFNTNVRAFIWFLCIFIFVFIFVGLLGYAIYHRMIKSIERNNKNQEQFKKEKKKHSLILFLILFVSFCLIMFLLIFYFPWNLVKAEFEQKSMDVKEIGFSILMIFVSCLLSLVISFLLTSLGYGIKVSIFKSKPNEENTNENITDETKELNEKEVKENVDENQKVENVNDENDEFYSKNNRITLFNRKKLIFPYLCSIDEKYYYTKIEKNTNPNTIDLKSFVEQFQSFLAKNKYYYEIKMLRAFIAGLNASRIILLEGLSGTGKSTLPRMFEEYIGGKCHFYPVQATWRDRSDVIGYYSDFTKKFKESEFLKVLYEANYKKKDINIMVLDEMNISRVEYYFADFLSILEYPKEDWLVPLVNDCNGIILPEKLEDGKIRIPENTWFIGTINIDDSTFSISDKVYDRAMVIDFIELSRPIVCENKSDPWPITSYELLNTFEQTMKKDENYLDDKETNKFIKLCDYFCEIFGVRFGNRIANQITSFLPIYVELGGSKEEALDYIFARKILRKVDGKFENYILVGLNKLYNYVQTSYGKGKFVETEAYIEHLRKKLS